MSVTYLVNGPIMTTCERREALVERMAKDLLRLDVAHDRQDAIRALHACGYSSVDIHVLIDDARACAFQEIVAVEISRP